MDDNPNLLSLQKLLEAEDNWPRLYLFKFIGKPESIVGLKKIFLGHKFSERPSSKGKYISLSIHYHAFTAEDIIEYYRQAMAIEGVICL